MTSSAAPHQGYLSCTPSLRLEQTRLLIIEYFFYEGRITQHFFTTKLTRSLAFVSHPTNLITQMIDEGWNNITVKW